MPTYRIHHLTRYTNDEPVSVCHNLAHLLPRDAPSPPRHTWRYADLDISPAPAVRAERLDYFGNRVTFFAIQEPHRELDVLTRSHVDLDPVPAQQLFSTVPWELVRDRLDLPLASQGAGGGGGGKFQLERNAECGFARYLSVHVCLALYSVDSGDCRICPQVVSAEPPDHGCGFWS